MLFYIKCLFLLFSKNFGRLPQDENSFKNSKVCNNSWKNFNEKTTECYSLNYMLLFKSNYSRVVVQGSTGFEHSEWSPRIGFKLGKRQNLQRWCGSSKLTYVGPKNRDCIQASLVRERESLVREREKLYLCSCVYHSPWYRSGASNLQIFTFPFLFHAPGLTVSLP